MKCLAIVYSEDGKVKESKWTMTKKFENVQGINIDLSTQYGWQH